ncbi:hypothetical protein HK105_205532 [Polyrhizophydium stewartii]|uniref:Fe2OG dioxygenase domain-containing protein n=1 Tax=Polyrhizophydium stewartii TaxID=2732419 RepID=A0ABR4N608_9FUNG
MTACQLSVAFGGAAVPSLDRFRVAAEHCDALYLVPAFLSPDEASAAASAVFRARRRWTTLRNRRLQVWGVPPVPPTKAGTAPPQARPAPPPEELPPWLRALADRIAATGALAPLAASSSPSPSASPPALNNCLVNEYRPGQGILPHEDGPLYEPLVATISLGESCLLDFYKKQPDAPDAPDAAQPASRPHPDFSIAVDPGSLLVLHRDAYLAYLHGIDESFDFVVAPPLVANAADFIRRELDRRRADALDRGDTPDPDPNPEIPPPESLLVHRIGTRISLTFRVART